MNDARKIILAKIKKCLALSKSSNEHEAEAALRQAHALMAKHCIDEQDMLAFEASEQHTKSAAKSNPAAWESALANKVAKAFGCKIIFAVGGYWVNAGHWKFIGCGVAPEIAVYGFQVLHRQCKRARTEHIKTHLKRCKPATKTRRADLFCEGWIYAVAGKIAALAGDERQTRAIEAYVAKHYPSLRDLEANDRNGGRNISNRELNDVAAGMQSGKNAELNRGMNGGAAPLALE